MPKKGAKRGGSGHWKPWEDGGRVWIDRDGRRTYYIRKQVGGRRYEVNTGASSASAAHEQLRRFEADPEGYDPHGERRPNPIHLDEDLSREFLAWSERRRATRRAGSSAKPRVTASARREDAAAPWAHPLIRIVTVTVVLSKLV